MILMVSESPEGWPHDRLGFAQPQARPFERAYILQNRVSAFVRKHQGEDAVDSDQAVVLGHAMAHELDTC